MSAPAEKTAISPEIRRLFEKRAVKKRELDSIDKDIERHLGFDMETRPQKPRMSAQDFNRRCGQ